MPKYLLQANYVDQGVKGLLKEGGAGRRAAVEKAIQAARGQAGILLLRLRGERRVRDADLADNASMTALALAVNASGVVTAKTTVLRTPEEVDQAVKKASAYRTPGQ